MGQIERVSPCLRIPATTPIRFIKPTQHKPEERVNLESSHMWSLTSIYTRCFMDNIFKNKILSAQKLARNIKSKNIRGLYRGINELGQAISL
jgi:hypothetical protein